MHDHKRVIAAFVGGWGHVEPLLPLVSLASGSDHDVSFAGQAAIAERLSQRGHRVDVVGPDTLRSTPARLVSVDREAERASTMSVTTRRHALTFIVHAGRFLVGSGTSATGSAGS